MAERKSFEGDRDAALGYLGEARAKLAILKNAMAFNKLQTLSRTYDYDNGVTITVAVVFGQDYISINVPPTMDDEVVREVANQTKLIGSLPITRRPTPEAIIKDFADTVYTSGSVTVVITRQAPASPWVRMVGMTTGVRSAGYWDSTGGGFHTFPKFGFNTLGEAWAISSDGTVAVGWVNNTTTPSIGQFPVKWASLSSTPSGPVLSGTQGGYIAKTINQAKTLAGCGGGSGFAEFTLASNALASRASLPSYPFASNSVTSYGTVGGQFCAISAAHGAVPINQPGNATSPFIAGSGATFLGTPPAPTTQTLVFSG